MLRVRFVRRYASAAPPATDYVTRILAAANMNRFGNALRLAKEQKAAKAKPDITVYNALMSLASNENSWLFSWAILDDMKKIGIQPNALTFTHFLNAQRQRPSNVICNALKRMYDQNVKPTPATYTAIINCFIHQGNVEMAFHYIVTMLTQGMSPEIVAVQNAIVFAAESGYTTVAVELASHYEESSSRRLDEAVWIACLSASAQHLQMTHVRLCWKLLTEQLNVAPNEGICISVLNTAARNGAPDLATDALRILKHIGVKWEEHHFGALMEAFCRNRQIKEALVTLYIMRTNEIQPTEATTSFLLDTITADVDSLDRAWSIIDDIRASDTGLDIDALKVVMQAAIKLGDFQRAVGLYKTLGHYNITADVDIFNLLLDGCIVAKHRHLGDVLLEDMKKLGVAADSKTYRKIIELCLTQDTYEDAFYYLEEMKSVFSTPPIEVYEALLEKCSLAGDSRRELVVQEMRECGYAYDEPRQRGRTPSERDIEY